MSSGKRHYSLRGQLFHRPRAEKAPNFLDFTQSSLGPILREWGNTLHIRIIGRTPTADFLNQLLSMISFLKLLQATRGELYVLQYMKCSYLYSVAYLSGQRQTDSWIFGTPVELAGGLPKWIPSRMRLRIRSGDLKIWRWVLSLMFSYKGLITPAPLPTLSTITAEPWDAKEELPVLLPEYLAFREMLEGRRNKKFSISDLSHHYPVKDTRDWVSNIGMSLSYSPNLYHEAASTLPILTSGPNGRPSVVYAGLDCLAWTIKGYSALKTYLELTSNWFLSIHFRTAFLDAASQVKYLDGISRPNPTPEELSQGWVMVRTNIKDSLVNQLRSTKALVLGRLSLKPEAAGKVRVFAIMDYWTQCALSPLHKVLVSILATLPSDATKDQHTTFTEFCKKDFDEVVCYDLSSATDLLPLQLQTQLLETLYGKPLADAWASILVDRDFVVPGGTALEAKTVRYTRGQPMGALSSWAILALTHHFLVFVAARRVGELNYWDYVICGDDIALSGEKVPSAYFSLCQELGIPISLPKTLKSKKTLDRPGWGPTGALVSFVSRLSLGSVDVTPWALKEEISIGTLGARVESVVRRFERGQVDQTSSWLCQASKMAATRLSDIERISKSFTSGELSDALVELLAPLLFPNPRSQVFGVKEGDFGTWLSVITRRPGITSLGPESIRKGMPFPTGFPVEAFIDELFMILWSRVVSAYDTASANTRLYYDWLTTARHHKSALALGAHSWSFMSTLLLTASVVRRRVTEEQLRINRIVTELRTLFSSPSDVANLPLGNESYLVVARTLTLPSYPSASLEEKIAALSYALKITSDMPNPEPLRTASYFSVRNQPAEGFFISKEVFTSQIRKALVEEGGGFRDFYNLKANLSASWASVGLPAPLVGMLTTAPGWQADKPSFDYDRLSSLRPNPARASRGVFKATDGPQVDVWSTADLGSLIREIFVFEDQSVIPAQLPDFPEYLDESEIVARRGPLFRVNPKASLDIVEADNPMYLGLLEERIGSEGYLRHLVKAQSWFLASQFRSKPWPPVTTSKELALTPFPQKESKAKSFGLSRPGIAFNRTLALLGSAAGNLDEAADT
nr:MAG: RNA-dependent RNA polymerase [Mitovirus sp.]